MEQKRAIKSKRWLARTAAFCVLVVLVVVAWHGAAGAQTIPPNPKVKPLVPLLPPDQQANSFGVQGKISSPPPTQAATISTPTNGQNFSNDPTITVAGFCQDGLLVKVFNNGIFVGSVICNNGSYSLQVNLFTGQNELSAVVFDDLDQSGPTSNIVTVTFNNANFSAFGTLITLTSVYARRGADPGKTLTWPLTLSGGSGPYALSIDWGDGQPLQLFSQPVAGNFSLEHVYKSAGTYKVVIKAVDANGVPAFLQLVAVANGQASDVAKNKDDVAGKTTVVKETKIAIIPIIILFIMAVLGFWLGRRYELVALRKRIEREAREFAEEEARQQ
ncbi:MAG: hypothetical protein WBP26_00955 [Candidatus Saccharimonadales bacterium]